MKLNKTYCPPEGAYSAIGKITDSNVFYKYWKTLIEHDKNLRETV